MRRVEAFSTIFSLTPTPLPQGEGRREGESGFTLFEVMIAVTILAFSLVAVYAASAGAVGATRRVERYGVATMLARCRMTEVEIGFRAEGFQLDDLDEEGACCEDEDEAAAGFTCHTKVEAVELPDMSTIQTAASGIANGDPLGLAGPPDAEGAAPGGEGEGLDEGLTAGLNVLYPLVSNVLQASIRRVTVEVSWTEGEEARTVQAVQYVTNPTQGVEAGKAPPPAEDEAAQPAPDGSGSGLGSGSGTGTDSGGFQR